MDSLAKRNYKSELLELDWDFPGQSGSAGLAGYHWYPARYVSQVPGILIGYFTEVGGRVLDPFCGSGTTLVEAKRLRRSATGIDTNPVAVLLSEAKLRDFNQLEFGAFAAALRNRIGRLLVEAGTGSDLVERIPNTGENSRWYHPATLRELAATWTAIWEEASTYRPVALVAFSSILRFACSQEKHWGWICDNVRPKEFVYRDAVRLFSDKLDEYEVVAASTMASCDREGLEYAVHVGRCDRVLGTYPDRYFDAVITSPPYCGVTDYARSQRLSFLWLDLDLDEARRAESGARYKRHRREALAEFLSDMAECFKEISRVLRTSGHCAVVIGESPNRDSYLAQFEQVLLSAGLSVEEQIDRRLPPQRSFSPQLQTERILLCRNVSHV